MVFSLLAGFIRNWDTFREIFLTKFGDDRTIASLINDLSNLKENSDERIKDFNSRFNKLLKKISAASKPVVDVLIEWYISSLPSNITIFVARANKATLVENMKVIMSLERRIISLKKRSEKDERKSKEVTFKDYAKKKSPKDFFDLEGLLKVLRTMLNVMVKIKKHVAESSTLKKPFFIFKINLSSIMLL